MADVIDDAQAYNEVYQAAALKNQEISMLPESDPSFDGWNCVDCGEEIPAKRLGWGRIRCCPCQELKERVARTQQRNGREER